MASSLNHAMLPASRLDGKQQLGGEERGEGERKPGQRAACTDAAGQIPLKELLREE